MRKRETKDFFFFEVIVQIIQAKLKQNNIESLTLNAAEYTPLHKNSIIVQHL